jgi:hypothetical protein
MGRYFMTTSKVLLGTSIIVTILIAITVAIFILPLLPIVAFGGILAILTKTLTD